MLSKTTQLSSQCRTHQQREKRKKTVTEYRGRVLEFNLIQVTKVETEILSRLFEGVYENLYLCFCVCLSRVIKKTLKLSTYECDPNQDDQGVDPVEFLDCDDDSGTFFFVCIDMYVTLRERDRERHLPQIYASA